MNNKEIKQNIPTKQIILDKQEGEIMWPAPSAEQDILWDKLDDLVSAEDLKRELKWINAPIEIKKYLASKEIADKVAGIGKRFNLDYRQIRELAKNIKYVFIREVMLKDFILIISQRLKIDKDLANKISQEIKSEIFIIQREFLAKIYPQSRPSQPQPTAPPIKPVSFQAVPPKTLISKLVTSNGQPVTSKPIVEPEPKFKAVPDSGAKSQAVFLDHFYDKLKAAKEERKDFLEKVLAEEENLPKTWQVAPSAPKPEIKIAPEVKKLIVTSNEQPIISKQETIKPEKSAILSKPPIRTMMSDLEKAKGKKN